MRQETMQDENVQALEFLRMKLEESKLRNPNWSMRAFAQKLGMSSGALSEILQGKRALSIKSRQKIIQKLNLSPSEQRVLLGDQLKPIKTTAHAFTLSADAFHLISDWWHFAILNLLKTKDFQPRLSWIADRVGLPKATAELAWKRLLRLGYIEKNAKGELKRRHPKMSTSDDILNLSIRKSHQEDLRLIEQALNDVPIESREFGSMTMAIKTKDLPRAKALIREFQDEFCDHVESDAADEVYRLSIAFYPLTKTKDV